MSFAPLIVDATDSKGNVRQGLHVSVHHLNTDGSLGGLAAGYADPGGHTPAANPMLTDSSGRAVMWMPRGAYAWVLSDNAGQQTTPEPFMASPAWDGSMDAQWLGTDIPGIGGEAIREVDGQGNIGLLFELDTIGSAETVLRRATIGEAGETRITLANLGAGYQQVTILGRQNVAGDGTLAIEAGGTEYPVRIPMVGSMDFTVLVEWDGSEARVYSPDAPQEAEHFQDIPASVWIFVHNLGREPAAVQVVDTAGTIVQCGVHHDSINQLTLTSTAPFSGRAKAK